MGEHDRSPDDVARAERRAGRRHLVVVGAALVVAVAVLAAFALLTRESEQSERFQASHEDFYTPPDPLPKGDPGDLIRFEPLTPAPPGAKAWRVLYLSTGPDGGTVAVSGMVFAPDGPVPEGGRPVVAWAHPTDGMADDCTPSRQERPGKDTTWLSGMLEKGWVVAATDYYGMGTPGTLPYLVGRSAAYDVLNSVRAARAIPEAGAGTRFATWGHSEGGHASLWAGQLAAEYAPELELVAVSAAAPAAELADLISEQWSTPIGQGIGPYATAAWSEYEPGVSAEDVLTEDGLRALPKLTSECIHVEALVALARAALHDDFFAKDPMAIAAWKQAADRNTPAGPPSEIPVFIAQGTKDPVVLPPTTTKLVEQLCSAGNPVEVDWMVGEGHPTAGNDAGPAVTAWLADRFDGRPTPGTCGPATPPATTDG